MKILMVCLGNICRSPLAEGILRAKVEKLGIDWEIDSAGTSSWHIGEMPDKRSIQKASEYDIDITTQRARQFQKEDLDYYDIILAMDASNYQDIKRHCENKSQEDKIKMILNYVYPNENRPVPDPYYNNSFEEVYQLLDRATDSLIAEYQ